MARSLNDDVPQTVVAKDAVDKANASDLTKPKDVAVEDIAEER